MDKKQIDNSTFEPINKMIIMRPERIGDSKIIFPASVDKANSAMILLTVTHCDKDCKRVKIGDGVIIGNNAKHFSTFELSDKEYIMASEDDVAIIVKLGKA